MTLGVCTFTFWSVHHRDCALFLSKHGEDGLLLRPLVGTDEGTEEGEWAGWLTELIIGAAEGTEED